MLWLSSYNETAFVVGSHTKMREAIPPFPGGSQSYQYYF